RSRGSRPGRCRCRGCRRREGSATRRAPGPPRSRRPGTGRSTPGAARVRGCGANAVTPLRSSLGSPSHRLAGEALWLEDLLTEPDSEVGELLRELGSHAGGLEVALEATVLVHAHAVVEQEDVLEGDHVALHALD